MLRHSISFICGLCLLSTASADLKYDYVADWLKLPEGREHIGNLHGEVDVDSKGNFYISVEGKGGALQVFRPDGSFSHAVPNMPKSLHGFVIKDDILYASVLKEGRVIKATLEGEILLEIPKSSFPEENFGPKGLRLTSVDVAPNGDIYVVDGYGLDWIYVFDQEGNLKKTFGGRVEPYHLEECHKLFIDFRYEEPRILCCDRRNLRLLHLDLEGNVIGTYVKSLRRPSSASFHGDFVVIAEIAGRVVVLDKEGEVVSELGTNDNKREAGRFGVAPERWQTGVVVAPHGVTFDKDGNIVVTEWNRTGRVHRWDLVE